MTYAFGIVTEVKGPRTVLCVTNAVQISTSKGAIALEAMRERRIGTSDTAIAWRVQGTT